MIPPPFLLVFILSKPDTGLFFPGFQILSNGWVEIDPDQDHLSSSSSSTPPLLLYYSFYSSTLLLLLLYFSTHLLLPYFFRLNHF